MHMLIVVAALAVAAITPFLDAGRGAGETWGAPAEEASLGDEAQPDEAGRD